MLNNHMPGSKVDGSSYNKSINPHDALLGPKEGTASILGDQDDLAVHNPSIPQASSPWPLQLANKSIVRLESTRTMACGRRYHGKVPLDASPKLGAY